MRVDGPALSRAAPAVTASVRAFTGPLGYDSFILYTEPRAGDGPDDVVEDLVWTEGE